MDNAVQQLCSTVTATLLLPLSHSLLLSFSGSAISHHLHSSNLPYSLSILILHR